MPVTIALIGAGSRGLHSYAPYALKYPDRAKIVAVAEPRPEWRESCVKQHAVAKDQAFSDWRELLTKPKMADAVIIATQDADHVEPVLAACKLGYDILLEKPMATNAADCRKIVAAVKSAGVKLTVCHVLRYTPYFRKFKELIDSGVIGDVVSVRHFEQVGFWHFAHSYVRGNWRNESLSTPMILAKACHDFDILCYMLSSRCQRLSSFGSLKHFTKKNRPADAADRCLDCKVADCPYSASKFYMQRLESGNTGWPLNVITADLSSAGVLAALRDGPYGRCVYNCDNDVVDHQIVAMEFENQISATMTVAAFTDEECRRTEILGSHGELRGDGATIKLTRFSDRQVETFDFAGLQGAGSGHMGGDFGIMNDFIDAVRLQTDTNSSAEVSLMSHLMAFAAEESRKSGEVRGVIL